MSCWSKVVKKPKSPASAGRKKIIKKSITFTATKRVRSKSYLTAHITADYIPLGFFTSKEWRKSASENPHKRFIVESWEALEVSLMFWSFVKSENLFNSITKNVWKLMGKSWIYQWITFGKPNDDTWNTKVAQERWAFAL